MSLQIPWDVHDSVEIAVLEGSFQWYTPACPGSRGLSSFLGWSSPCHSQLALQLGIHFVVSSFVTRGDIRRTNPIKPCRAPGIAIHQPHFCLLRVCILFSLNTQRSWSGRGASPEQRAALPGNLWHLQFCQGDVLRTHLAARRSLILFFAHLVGNLRLLLTGMPPENHSPGMTGDGVHLKQIFSSHLWGCLENTSMFHVRNSSCLAQKELSGLGEQTRAPARPCCSLRQELPGAELKLHCSPQIHLNTLVGTIRALRGCSGVAGRYFPMFCQQNDFWHLFLHWDVPILLWGFVYTQGIKMFWAPGISMKGTKKWMSRAIWSLNHVNWEETGAENWAESWPGWTVNSS